jgi:phosphoribosylglycinamide formyltransferase 2
VHQSVTDKNGDYQESWQPATILDKDLYEAKTEKSYRSLRWCRTFGVEFFLADDGVYFRTPLAHMIPEW